MTLYSSEPPLHDLFSIPDTNAKWFDIGVGLGIDRNMLSSIKASNNNDLKRKREMFRKVMEARPNLTWRVILRTLQDVGEVYCYSLFIEPSTSVTIMWCDSE